MKFILQLAIKNLSRYKRRTAITAFSIAVGLMMFVIVDSILKGSQAESVRNLRWYETASLRIYDTQYWDEHFFLPLDYSIENPDKVMEILKKEKITATERTMFAADMVLYSQDFGEDGNLSVQVTAIDPETDFDVYHYSDTLQDGRFLKPGEMDGIVIGSWLAEDIGAKVGYFVTLLTQGNGGFYQAFDMQIVGIVNCPNPNVNRSLVMMDKDAADSYLGMDGAVTSIDIAMNNRADLRKAASSLQKKMDEANLNLHVYTWMDLSRDYLAVAGADQGSSNLILFFVFIIAAIGVSNTMLMAMYERIREIGMMRALGLYDRSIFAVFLLEAGGIGFIGSIIGIALGCLVNIYLVNTGIDFGSFFRDANIGYRIQSVMRGEWNIATLIKAFFSGIVLAMLVAYFPIKRAMKLDIPTCLHHQ